MVRGKCGATLFRSATTAKSNCDAAPTVTQTKGLPSGSLFPAGITTIEYTAKDVAGNSSTCSFTVTVSPDAQAPVISGCPANIGPVPMDTGKCGATVTWTAPTAKDNCDAAPTVTQTKGLPSGSIFPAGTTTIEYTAKDVAGNSSTCSFTVTVNVDAEAPVISGCPGNIGPVPMNLGKCGAIVSWTGPTAKDNCDAAPTVTQTKGLASGSLFPAGTTTIEYTAKDATGNSSTCSFTVTVNRDAEPPVISGCPGNIGPVPMDLGKCGAIVSWTVPTATDNCDAVPTVTQTKGLASGSLFPAGTTTIEYTAKDVAGNSSTCSFTVTVNGDAEAPVISGCPGNIGPVPMDLGECGAIVSWTEPKSTDHYSTETTVSHAHRRVS